MTEIVEFKPYTYLIKWSKLDVWYYGAKYSKDANPENLWKTYFTSSNHVKSFIEEHGDPDVIEIRKTFKDGKQALKWEQKVLRRMKVLLNNRCLNKSIGGFIHIPVFSENHKRKISEAIKRLPKTPEKYNHMIKMSEIARTVNLGKKRPEHSELLKARYKNGEHKMPRFYGDDHPLRKKGGHSEETKKKLSLARKGKRFPRG